MERVVHYKKIRIGHLVYGIWILLGGVLYNLGSTYVATTLRDGGVGTVEHACVRIYSLLDSTSGTLLQSGLEVHVLSPPACLLGGTLENQ